MNVFDGLRKKKKINVFPLPGYESLLDIPELHPKPAGAFIPKWFKSIHPKKGTIKDCPVIPEYLSQGIVVPMWCDLYIKVTDNELFIETPQNYFEVEQHENGQFLNYINPDDNRIYGIVKLICPWLIQTSKNLSVYQLPTTYHFNADFSVMPGTIRTDVHHTINQQLFIHKKNEWIFIQRGTPIVHYIPYINKKIKYKIGHPTKKQLRSYNRQEMILSTKFFSAYKLNR